MKLHLDRHGPELWGNWGRISLRWGRARGNSAEYYRWVGFVIDIRCWRYLDLTFTTHAHPTRWEQEDECSR